MNNDYNQITRDLNYIIERRSYINILYALILKSDYETSKKLFEYIFGEKISLKMHINDYSYLLLQIFIYHNFKSKTSFTPDGYEILAQLLQKFDLIIRNLNIFNFDVLNEYTNYVNQLIKSFLITKQLLYWENYHNKYLLVHYFILNKDDRNEIQYKEHVCRIKRKGRFLYISGKDFEFAISKIREIEEKPSINRFATIYEAIGMSLNIAAKDYCPFCNPKHSLTKKRSKESNACSDCSNILNFIAEHGNIQHRSLTNAIQQFKTSAPLLSKIQQKGNILLKYLNKINHDSEELQKEFTKIENLIIHNYYLKKNKDK